ncbi:PDZ domain-containing protein [bacterium]|nr:PDZ domain-containing protein [bacterium]
MDLSSLRVRLKHMCTQNCSHSLRYRTRIYNQVIHSQVSDFLQKCSGVLFRCLVPRLSIVYTAVLSAIPSFAFCNPLLQFEQETVEIYRKTNEAVVFISTQSMSNDSLDIYGYTANDSARSQSGAGSGVVVDAKEGIILTSLHVISDAESIDIFLADGKSYRARLLGHDPESDLAVLQLTSPPADLKAIAFGDSRSLQVGQWVFAIGNPHGLARTLTSGIVSSLHRTVRNPKNVVMKDLIQTDAALNPGSSGGPLLNSKGELIGINAAILSQSGDSAGISFAVPIHRVRAILSELIATGKVLRPRVGWLLVDTNQGPLVRRILPGSPAEEAGIEPLERPVGKVFRGGVVRDFDRADLITAIDGKKMRSVEDVEATVLAARHGEALRISLRRGGNHEDQRTVTLKPALQ